MSWRYQKAESGAPRVLLVTQRGLQPAASRGLRFEFEDQVQELDVADLAGPDGPVIASPLMRRAARAADRAVPGLTSLLARDRPPLAARYELVFVALEALSDLLVLQPIDWLLRLAPASICFVDEVWRKGLRDRGGELRLLRPFDRVLLGTAGSVEELQELSGRPCGYLPPSVDAAALCPYPLAPARAIDVYSMGRRSPQTHGALLELAERRLWFYLYDTLAANRVQNHREHRRQLGNLLRRTRYFLAYPGKADAAVETGGQSEIGFRYFEGAAAGALLVGEPPANPWFERLFGWPDAIVPLAWGSTAVEEALAPLEADPARVERARRANVAGALLHHDHVYRWAEILSAVGLPETAAMERRRRELRRLAALACSGDGMPGPGARPS
ncbi:MAG: glycosyltransferase family 1 protein [Deltaproteobacteria bacterium]|nr:glycosyltransferase family 1 protein [Deltaproteobacteria bacterium]